MRILALVLLCAGTPALTLASPRVARADEPCPTTTPPVVVEDVERGAEAERGIERTIPYKEWYGWQTLMVDAVSAATFASGVALSSTRPGAGLTVLGLGGIIVGSPIVHWSHGHVGRGFASAALHTVLPSLTASLAVLGFACESDGCVNVVMAATPLLGVVLASAIDAAVLGYDAKSRPASDARSWAPRHVVLAPALTITPTLQQAGLSGAF